MKKALTGPDIGQLVEGWQSLVGSRVDQFGRPDLNKIVLKLRSREKGTVRLLIDLSGWGRVYSSKLGLIISMAWS